MKAKALIIGTLAIAIAAPAFAQARWSTVGYKTVGLGTDRDTIRVRGNDRSRQVRLCTFNRPIRLLDFDITYANGGRQDAATRERLGAGQCTRGIDLNGRRRNISQVRIAYERIDRRFGAPLVRVQVR